MCCLRFLYVLQHDVGLDCVIDPLFKLSSSPLPIPLSVVSPSVAAHPPLRVQVGSSIGTIPSLTMVLPLPGSLTLLTPSTHSNQIVLPTDRLPSLRPFEAHELLCLDRLHGSAAHIGAQPAASQPVQWEEHHRNVTHLDHHFGHPVCEPLASWVGEAATSSNFFLTVSRAHHLFHPGGVRDRANARAHDSDVAQVDWAQVDDMSRHFEADPLGTIDQRCAQFASSVITPDILRDPMVASAPPDLIRRMVAASIPIEPIFAPSFRPDPEAAQVRPAMAATAPALLALVWVGYLKGESILVRRESFLKGLLLHSLTGHTSEIHHFGKPDDFLGRLCWDYSNLSQGTPVNG